MDWLHYEPKEHHGGCLVLNIVLQSTDLSRIMVGKAKPVSHVKSCSSVFGRHVEYE